MTPALAGGWPAATVAHLPAWASTPAFPFSPSPLALRGCEQQIVDEGSGPPVVFLPGSPMWSFMWRAAVQRLRGRYRCVCADLPGLGLSLAPRCRTPFARNAAVFGDLLRTLDLRDAVVVAHATSGPSAVAMVAEHRDRVRGLVLNNTFGWPLWDSGLATVAKVVGSWPFSILNVNLNLLARVTARKGRRTGRFSPAEAAAVRGPFARRVARHHLQDLLRALTRERAFFEGLPATTRSLGALPTLLMFGAHDNGYQAGGLQRWQELLVRHTAVVLPESAHFAIEDEPERFVDELEGWLDGPEVRDG